jgi:hypothetical protein
VADWLAEGLKTMALRCGCGHFATVTLADLPPEMTGPSSGNAPAAPTAARRAPR